jgi:hypothetical protein
LGRIAVRWHGATRAGPATPVRRGLVAILAGAIALAAVLTAAPHGVPPARAMSVDDWFAGLQAAAARHDERIVVVGTRTKKPDPHDDQQGPKNPLADVRTSEVYDVNELPDWMLADPFACTAEGTTCSPQGAAEPETFDSGGWLFVIEVGAPIATLPAGMRLEVGVLVKLVQSTGATAPGSAINGSSHINVFRQEGETRSVLEFGIGTGAFEERETRTRANVSENIVALFVPKLKDWPTAPEAWTPYAFVSDGTEGGTSRDVGVTMGDPPAAIGTPPTLTFEALSEATTAPATEAPATPGATAAPIASTGPTPAASATGTPTGGEVIALPIVGLLVGLGLIVIGWLILRSRRKAR